MYASSSDDEGDEEDVEEESGSEGSGSEAGEGAKPGERGGLGGSGGDCVFAWCVTAGKASGRRWWRMQMQGRGGLPARACWLCSTAKALCGALPPPLAW